MSGKERRSFSAERKVEALRKKLADKNEVIAELVDGGESPGKKRTWEP